MATSNQRKPASPGKGAERGCTGGAEWVRRREAEALRLRTAGFSYREVGDQLGVGETMSRRIVQRALRRVLVEPGIEVIALECQRLDLLTSAAMPRALAGSARWAEVAIRVMERRARLLGLDAPTRSEVHVMTADEQEALDREIEALLEQYRDPGGDR
jgi:hypothetical protein